MLEIDNVSVKRTKRRPYLHPVVFDEVRTCAKCVTNERMMFWRNVKSSPDYQFEFSVCKVCGYTVVFESFVRFSGAKIDLDRPDIIGFLHELTKGARAAATRYLDPDVTKKAISIHNFRYITVDEERKIVSVFDEKKKRVANEKREREEAAKRNNALVVDGNITRANGISRKLVVTRIAMEERRKEKMKPANFSCKFCNKKFITKAALHNHRCDTEQKETYIERCRRYAGMRSELSNSEVSVG